MNADALLTVSKYGLTDANWEQPWPAVVLLADPYWGANEPESGVALVNHRVSVAKVLPNHLPVNDLLRNTTVTSCGAVRRNKRTHSTIKAVDFQKLGMKRTLWSHHCAWHLCSQNTFSDPIFALLIITWSLTQTIWCNNLGFQQSYRWKAFTAIHWTNGRWFHAKKIWLSNLNSGILTVLRKTGDLKALELWEWQTKLAHSWIKLDLNSIFQLIWFFYFF